MTDHVIVGTLGGAFGVSGEVRLKSFCADPEAIADYVPLHTSTGLTIQQVILTGRTKAGFTAKIDAILTKEQADELKGVEIFADRSLLPSLPDDEFYYADLIGLTVLVTGGETIGTVKNVMDHGAGDLLEILSPGASDTLLLPFTKAIVPTVDLEAGRIIIDPPDAF